MSYTRESGVVRLARRWDELLLTLMRKYYIIGHPETDGAGLVERRNTRSVDKKLFKMKRPVTEGYRQSPVFTGETCCGTFSLNG